jgi:hypothetical protein
VLGGFLGGVARSRGNTGGTATAGLVLGGLAVVAAVVFWIINHTMLT